MPKNAQGTWVGRTASPTFKTYQTAGQLTPPPASSAPTAATPPPPGAGQLQLGDLGQPVTLPGAFPVDQSGAFPMARQFANGILPQMQQTAVVEEEDPRAALATALMGGPARPLGRNMMRK